MDIRSVIGELIKETNKIVAELGNLVYRPIGGLISSYMNLLKECDNIFNNVASFGVYVFVPRIRAGILNFPPSPTNGKMDIKAASGIAEGLSLQPYITYSINVIRRLHPSTRLTEDLQARTRESLFPSIGYSDSFEEVARYSLPLMLASNRLAESSIPTTVPETTRELSVLAKSDRELAKPITVVAESFGSLRRSFEGLGPSQLSMGKQISEGAVKVVMPKNGIFSDIMKTATMIYSNLVATTTYGAPVLSGYQTTPLTVPDFSKAAGGPEYKMPYPTYAIYKPILSDLFMSQEHLRAPLLADIVNKMPEPYITQPSYGKLVERYQSQALYIEPSLSPEYGAIYPFGLSQSLIALSLPIILGALKSLYRTVEAAPHSEIASVTPTISFESTPLPHVFKNIDSLIYSPLKEALWVKSAFLPIISAPAPIYSLFDSVKGEYLQEYVVAKVAERSSVSKAVDVGGYGAISSSVFSDVIKDVVRSLKGTDLTWNEALMQKTLLMLDNILMKEMQVVRVENLSPLIAIPAEYSRTLRTFRLAEEQAQREFIEANIPTSIEPQLTPPLSSGLRREVQNIFNITVPEGADIDIRELERKITQILNEQVRRYYGSLP